MLARTEEGKQIIQEAIKAGYLDLVRVEPATVLDSQKALLRRRRHLWGRLIVMKLLLVPVPHYDGFDLFGNWMKLPAAEKLRSFVGTMKRIVSRGWIRPLKPATGEGQVRDSKGGQKHLISPDESRV